MRVAFVSRLESRAAVALVVLGAAGDGLVDVQDTA
jgi:hypothetical protein